MAESSSDYMIWHSLQIQTIAVERKRKIDNIMLFCDFSVSYSCIKNKIECIIFFLFLMFLEWSYLYTVDKNLMD